MAAPRTGRQAQSGALRRVSVVLGTLGVLLGCGAAAAAVEVETLRIEVLRTLPHDTSAFTQGLLYLESAEGPVFIESTGLYGQSTVRRVDAVTGAVRGVRHLSAAEFGEGVALVGDRIVQLTWKSGVAHVYERDGLSPLGSFRYKGEGWGLCWDGEHLVMSDGSSTLQLRRATDFAVVRQVVVRIGDTPLARLNELECAGGFVYANVWTADQIVKIDPASGAVVAVIDAGGLLTPAERAAADVLNGIAYSPATDTFYITGKLWPKVFEVRLRSAAPR